MSLQNASAVPRPPDIRLHRLSASVRRAFRWWTTQTSLALPVSVRRRLGLAPDRLILALQDGRVTAALHTAEGVRDLGEFAPDGVPPPQLQSYLRGPLSDRTRNVVVLPQNCVLRCTTRLPRAAQENLRQVLRYEMDVLTPFTAEQVHFDWRVTAELPDGIEVRLQIVPRAQVDQATQLARRLGLRLHAVTVDGNVTSDETSDTGVNLLPPELRPARYTGRQYCNRALSAVLLMLLAVNVAAPFWRQKQRLDAAEIAVETARSEAQSTLALRRQLDAATAALERMRTLAASRASLLRVIDELSARIPDDTWLRRLDITANRVQLEGESAAASALIAVIEESPLFADVAFTSPVTHDARSGKESFRIAAALEGSLQADRKPAAGDTPRVAAPDTRRDVLLHTEDAR